MVRFDLVRGRVVIFGLERSSFFQRFGGLDWGVDIGALDTDIASAIASTLSQTIPMFAQLAVSMVDKSKGRQQ